MPSDAQITANIENAQLSTGPKSEAGKAAVSKNSVTHGLYSGDFVRSGEEQAHAELTTSLQSDLRPAGILEQTMVEEVGRAMWRLRRCGEVESRLARWVEGEEIMLDPMEAINASSEKIQRSVDRARSQAHRLLHKCMAELRRLQAQRKAAGIPEAKQTQLHAVPIARNAPCPCNSGQKYKRCCGRSAPPLQEAA